MRRARCLPVEILKYVLSYPDSLSLLVGQGGTYKGRQTLPQVWILGLLACSPCYLRMVSAATTLIQISSMRNRKRIMPVEHPVSAEGLQCFDILYPLSHERQYAGDHQ